MYAPVKDRHVFYTALMKSYNLISERYTTKLRYYGLTPMKPTGYYYTEMAQTYIQMSYIYSLKYYL